LVIGYNFDVATVVLWVMKFDVGCWVWVWTVEVWWYEQKILLFKFDGMSRED